MQIVALTLSGCTELDDEDACEAAYFSKLEHV